MPHASHMPELYKSFFKLSFDYYQQDFDVLISVRSDQYGVVDDDSEFVHYTIA